MTMTKEKRIFITYLFPGSFFPEEITEHVESTELPSKIPRDCFGFRFHEIEVIIDGKQEFEGKRKELPLANESRHIRSAVKKPNHARTYIVGERVHHDDIPSMIDGRDTDILKGNIERNSPTKTAIRTHLGNWQQEDEYHACVSPNIFAFGEPKIYGKDKK